MRQNFALMVRPLGPVTLGSLTVSPTQVSLSLSGESGPDYTLQTSTNLFLNGAWTSVLTTNLTASPIQLQHPFPADNSAQRFYRVLIGPQ